MRNKCNSDVLMIKEIFNRRKRKWDKRSKRSNEKLTCPNF